MSPIGARSGGRLGGEEGVHRHVDPLDEERREETLELNEPRLLFDVRAHGEVRLAAERVLHEMHQASGSHLHEDAGAALVERFGQLAEAHRPDEMVEREGANGVRLARVLRAERGGEHGRLRRLDREALGVCAVRLEVRREERGVEAGTEGELLAENPARAETRDSGVDRP